MNLNPSNTQTDLATLTAFNANKEAIIKGFVSTAGGIVDYTDEPGTAHSILLLPGQIAPIGGRISIVDTTVPALLIFL